MPYLFKIVFIQSYFDCSHKKSSNEGQKSKKCSKCNAAFATNQPLHIDSVHEGKKQFQCSLCDAKSLKHILQQINTQAVHERKKA